MKRHLAVAAVALLCASPAHAQFFGGTPVIDFTAIGKLAQQLGIQTDQLTTLGEQYTVLANQLSVLQQSYAEIVNTYHALSGAVNTGTWGGILNSAGMRNPMPFTTSVSSGYFSGLTSPSSLPYGSTYLQANTIGALPSGTGFNANQIVRAVQAISTIQAVATGNLQALETRASGLYDIQAQIDQADTLQKQAAIQARLAAEQNYAQVQTAQAQNLLVQAVAQQQAAEQREQQATYQHHQAEIAAACNAVSNTGMKVTLAWCQNGGTQ